MSRPDIPAAETAVLDSVRDLMDDLRNADRKTLRAWSQWFTEARAQAHRERDWDGERIANRLLILTLELQRAAVLAELLVSGIDPDARGKDVNE